MSCSNSGYRDLPQLMITTVSRSECRGRGCGRGRGSGRTITHRLPPSLFVLFLSFRSLEHLDFIVPGDLFRNMLSRTFRINATSLVFIRNTGLSPPTIVSSCLPPPRPCPLGPTMPLLSRSSRRSMCSRFQPTLQAKVSPPFVRRCLPHSVPRVGI